MTIQRKLFYERKQSSGETIDEWITQLRLIETDCEFHNQDEMIRDMIVLNSVNKKVQERLLETDDLDLSKASKIAKIHEPKFSNTPKVYSAPCEKDGRSATEDLEESRRR